MIKVLISFPFHNESPALRLPEDPEIQWIFNENADDVDLWIVHEDLCSVKSLTVRARGAVLITSEPPMQRRYPTSYFDQFDLVVTCHEARSRSAILNWQQCYPWHVGWSKNLESDEKKDGQLSYKLLSGSALPPKTKALSVVCSSDSRLPGHQKRLEFVRRLKDLLGDGLDWYGRGVRPIDDKWSALSSYHYHLSLENSRLPHYWTEKIGDAFLAGCFPIYWGAPNIDLYFDPSGFEVIDLSEPRKACEQISTLIAKVPSESMLAGVVRNRAAVLDDYSYRGFVSAFYSRFSSRPLRAISVQSLRCYRGTGWRLMERGFRFPQRLSYTLGRGIK